MKGVCQSTLTLEGYRAESLPHLTKVHDQWEAFFDQQDHTQPEARTRASSERDYVFIFWKNPESYKFLTKAKQLQSSVYQNVDP